MRADLDALISIDSQNPPGQESAVAAYLADRIRSMGGEAGLLEVAPGRPNVIGTFTFGEGPTLRRNDRRRITAARSHWLVCRSRSSPP